MKKNESNEKMLGVRIPKDLHDQLKISAVRNGKTAQNIIIELLSSYIELEEESTF
jgi:predicted DNA-binding protein